RPLAGRVVEKLRGDRRVNQRTPQTTGSVVESGGCHRQLVSVLFWRPQSASRAQDVSVILGQPFVNPEQLILHRLLIIGCREQGGPPVLAVPGVKVFVREHAPGETRLRLVNERALGHTAVVRLMMFESEVRDAVAQGEEEVIVVVVLRARERLCLLDELAHAVYELRGGFERGGAVGCDVHLDRWLRGLERDDAEVFAREHGRVNEVRQRGGREINLPARLALDRQGRAELPARRKLQRSVERYVVRVRDGRVKKNPVPRD